MDQLPIDGGTRLRAGLAMLDPLNELIDLLVALARRRVAQYFRRRRGTTLRPGTDTPLWNALVLSVRPHLRPWGSRSLLARELGVPPQRIHEYFKSRHQLPDAERTLALLVWLRQQQPKPRRARRRR